MTSDPWAFDGFHLCYVRPSPLHQDDDSVAVRDLVTAPPTLHIDELGSWPLFTPSSSDVGECNVHCFEIKSPPPPLVAVPQRVANERLERVRAAVLASFDLHRDVARDVIALGCDLTVDEWRAVLPTPPSRSFGVARLCRLIEQCRPCEAICDAVLLSVLPKLALVCTLNEDDDDDPLSPVSLPPDVGALLGLLASHSSLKRIPLALLQSHALLEPLTHALSNGAFFRQHILTCVLSDRACRPESSATSAADVPVPETIFASAAEQQHPLDLDDDVLLLT
jgi:hypothetical protein